MKSASLISSVHCGFAVSPSATLPGGVARSIVHVLVGFASLNWNTVLTFSAVAGFPATNVPTARKMSALVGTADAVGLAAGLVFGAGFGISLNSSIAALEITTTSRSLTLQRNTIF